MTLQEAATAAGLSPDAALTALQDAGLVSDLCLSLDGIARPDAWKAMRWFYDRTEERKRVFGGAQIDGQLAVGRPTGTTAATDGRPCPVKSCAFRPIT